MRVDHGEIVCILGEDGDRGGVEGVAERLVGGGTGVSLADLLQHVGGDAAAGGLGAHPGGDEQHGRGSDG